MNARCPLPISIVSGDGVADVRHIPVISTVDGGCENLSLGSAASCASLDHPDVLVALTVHLKKVLILLVPNMTTTEVVSVVNPLDRDQIFRLLRHFLSSEMVPFPKEYIVSK